MGRRPAQGTGGPDRRRALVVSGGRRRGLRQGADAAAAGVGRRGLCRGRNPGAGDRHRTRRCALALRGARGVPEPARLRPGPAVTGGGVYLADYLGTVYALDPADGRDRWRIATEARQSTEPVLVAHGAVHLGSGKALYTLDAVTGTPRWRFQAGAEVIGAPVVAEGRVHFGSADHCLYTLDAMGGQLRWKLATGGEITGSPVAVGGVVYACSKDRCVYALDAAKGTGLARRS